MVGKVSERVLLREGLEKTDNGMKQSSWPDVPPINQKNYYTDYMKREDQILPLRILSEAAREKVASIAKERERSVSSKPTSAADLPPPPEEEHPTDVLDPSKIIVIHPGSQNLRIGFANDAFPKSIPMVLATKSPQTESDEFERRPRLCPPASATASRREKASRSSSDPDSQADGEVASWKTHYTQMSNDLKIDMRANKRKVLPNSKELVQNYNRRAEPEVIPLHNDPLQVDWTDVSTLEDSESLAACFYGQAALRIPENSHPTFRLWRPLRHGCLNEADYTHAEHLLDDLETIIDKAIRVDLGLRSPSQWSQYACVVVVPDLYDKKYVEALLRSCAQWFEFHRVCFIQEGLAATFGAGYTQACVVDVGAQKTSVTCVEDGLCIDDSRINLKFGGYDVTETFINMMLHENFPYPEINLQRRYDFLLAEELKISHCTLSQADISVQLAQFHLRVPDKPTYKYQFKTYDEVILAPMSLYEPTLFDHTDKLRGRRRLLGRSYNTYDGDIPDEPTSAAQLEILAAIQPSLKASPSEQALLPHPAHTSLPNHAGFSTPTKDRQGTPQSFLSRVNDGLNAATPSASKASSPTPDGFATPLPPHLGTASALAMASPSQAGTGTASARFGTPGPPAAATEETRSAEALAIEQEKVLPIAPLDVAILTSIRHASRGDERKFRDLAGSIMVIGGGSKIPQFTTYLEERLRRHRPDLTDKIVVSRSAKDIDEQLLVWKGATVFSKLPTNDSWVTPLEYERLGVRVLHHKTIWPW